MQSSQQILSDYIDENNLTDKLVNIIVPYTKDGVLLLSIYFNFHFKRIMDTIIETNFDSIRLYNQNNQPITIGVLGYLTRVFNLIHSIINKDAFIARVIRSRRLKTSLDMVKQELNNQLHNTSAFGLIPIITTTIRTKVLSNSVFTTTMTPAELRQYVNHLIVSIYESIIKPKLNTPFDFSILRDRVNTYLTDLINSHPLIHLPSRQHSLGQDYDPNTGYRISQLSQLESLHPLSQ
jgi:hypothetical protein